MEALVSTLTISAKTKNFEIAVFSLLIVGWGAYAVTVYKPSLAINQNLVAQAGSSFLTSDPKLSSASPLKTKKPRLTASQNTGTELSLAVEQANISANAFVVTLNESKSAKTLLVNGDWLLLTDANRTRVSGRNFEIIEPALSKLQFETGKLNLYIDYRSDTNPVHTRAIEKFVTSYNKSWNTTLRLNDSLATKNQLTYEVIK
jgi:hypothetical protein